MRKPEKADIDIRIEDFPPAHLKWLEADKSRIGKLLYEEIESCLFAQAYLSGERGDSPQSRLLRAEEERKLLKAAYLELEKQRRLSPEGFEAAYEEWLRENPPESQVRFDFLLLREEKEAEEVLKRLRAGESFDALSRGCSLAHSEASFDEEPSLWWDRAALQQVVQKPMVADVFSLSPGSTSRRPVKAGNGWAIVHLLARRLKEPPTLERLRRVLEFRILRQCKADILARARERSRIEVLLPDPPEDLSDLRAVAALVEGQPVALETAVGKQIDLSGGKEPAVPVLKLLYPKLLREALDDAVLGEAGRREGLDRDSDLQYRLKVRLRSRFALAEKLHRSAAMAKVIGEEDVLDPGRAIGHRGIQAAVMAKLEAEARIEVLREL